MNSRLRNTVAALLIAASGAATLSTASAAKATPQGVSIGPWLSPGSTALKAACTRGEADTRLGLDRSSSGILIIKGGESPVAWHGAVANAYRYCRQLALSLDPMPLTSNLARGVTQQLTVGTSGANREASATWEASLAYGNVRVPTLTRAEVWDEASARGYVAFHFDVAAVEEAIKKAAAADQNLYILIGRGGSVQRIHIRK